MCKQSNEFMFKSISSLYFVDRLCIAYMDKILVSIFLIANLNLSMLSSSFVYASIISQILEPRYDSQNHD